MDWQCRICEQRGYPMILPCGHTFCDECVVKCHTCAYCRQDFDIFNVILNFDLVSNQTKTGYNCVTFVKDASKMDQSNRSILEMIHDQIYGGRKQRFDLDSQLSLLINNFQNLCQKYQLDPQSIDWLVTDLSRYLNGSFRAKEVWFTQFMEPNHFIDYFNSVMNVSKTLLEHRLSSCTDSSSTLPISVTESSK